MTDDARPRSPGPRFAPEQKQIRRRTGVAVKIIVCCRLDKGEGGGESEEAFSRVRSRENRHERNEIIKIKTEQMLSGAVNKATRR